MEAKIPAAKTVNEIIDNSRLQNTSPVQGVSFLNETTELKGLMNDNSFGGDSSRQDISQNQIQSSTFFKEVATKD